MKGEFCPRCGCKMIEDMKGVGPPVWVCTNPKCHHVSNVTRGVK